MTSYHSRHWDRHRASGILINHITKAVQLDINGITIADVLKVDGCALREPAPSLETLCLWVILDLIASVLSIWRGTPDGSMLDNVLQFASLLEELFLERVDLHPDSYPVLGIGCVPLLRCLTLKDCSVEVIPKFLFQNLRCLELSSWQSDRDCHTLINVLQHAPLLEKLLLTDVNFRPHNGRICKTVPDNRLQVRHPIFLKLAAEIPSVLPHVAPCLTPPAAIRDILTAHESSSPLAASFCMGESDIRVSAWRTVAEDGYPPTLQATANVIQIRFSETRVLIFPEKRLTDSDPLISRWFRDLALVELQAVGLKRMSATLPDTADVFLPMTQVLALELEGSMVKDLSPCWRRSTVHASRVILHCFPN
ncbi:hypothetical protein NEOLEDRAFT_1149911 [Neolentinus lepideus HHB14362 ss-1]|uniref:F-box domain-containing protein n=1 Tax=Neolentinus lepideus HHB14362 ss-1 TaxID=1314782 RepID=A0A165QP67_9AGAM|nr:hypothetical protein NEOLEDRAFT_1149911 [Neolentinus lepideus HHB14362 ss-1]